MHNKKDVIRCFADLYIREQTCLILTIAILISALLFVVALFYDVLRHELFITLIPLLLGIIFLFPVYLKTYRFRDMIRVQEQLLNAHFDDDLFTPLYPKTLFFSSDSWFIKSGCWAFHKAYLKKITVRVINEKTRSRSYIVEFHTVEGAKIMDKNMLSREIQQLKQWHKRQQNMNPTL